MFRVAAQCRRPTLLRRHFRPSFPSINACPRPARRWQSTAPADPPSGPIIYNGPLAGPLRNLKLFSISSLTLSLSLSPFILVIPAPLPASARIILAATAVSASAFSTFLIAWGARSYVNVIRRVGATGMELDTADFLLRKVTTTVHDTSVLMPSDRPLATWELPDNLEVLEQDAVEEGSVRELARAVDWKGRVRGKWIAEYKRDASGRLKGLCRAQGNIPRYFNVVEDLVKNAGIPQ